MDTNENRKWIYYIRNKKKMPVVTVCLIKHGNDISRGISICSKKDKVIKARGRNIAIGRAEKAIINKESTEETIRMEVEQIEEEMLNCVQYSYFDFYYQYKSCFNPTLTDYEKKLIGDSWKE